MWRPWSDSTSEESSEYSLMSNDYSQNENFHVLETTQEPETQNNTSNDNSTSIIPETSDGTSVHTFKYTHYQNYQDILSEQISLAGKKILYFTFIKCPKNSTKFYPH